jgi:hypothetical protein
LKKKKKKKCRTTRTQHGVALTHSAWGARKGTPQAHTPRPARACRPQAHTSLPCGIPPSHGGSHARSRCLMLLPALRSALPPAGTCAAQHALAGSGAAAAVQCVCCRPHLLAAAAAVPAVARLRSWLAAVSAEDRQSKYLSLSCVFPRRFPALRCSHTHKSHCS